jgi:hypothetical protein
VCDPESAQRHRKTSFDVLFVKYGMLKFSQHRDEALEIYGKAKLIVNLENDYLFALDKRFRPPDESWSTVAGRAGYVNWNILTRHGVDAWRAPRPLRDPELDGLIYYGAHRPDRVESFRRYFKEPPYKLTISTFRGRRQFEETCGAKNVTVVGAMRDPDAPARYQMTLYIEDEASHALYCSPATRFYECVMMGLAQAIDVRAVGTLTTAGIRVADSWVVRDKTDLKRRLSNSDSIRSEQRREWFRDYSVELRKQFAAQMERIGR